MIYGMYLSATGVVTNSYRQDVIANNIANSETVGFKRDLAQLRQRTSAVNERGGLGPPSDPLMGNLDSGMFAAPTMIDMSQGEMEQTGNNLDVAIQGTGFFAVQHNGQTSLTRNGQLQVKHDGQLVLSADPNQVVLDTKQNPIRLDSTSPVTIGRDGTISQDGKEVASIGVFDVADPSRLKKEGGTLMTAPPGDSLTPSSAVLRSEFIERSNAEPATELTALMDAQRQLEANANMIKTQDETLDKLVNDVGKIS